MDFIITGITLLTQFPGGRIDCMGQDRQCTQQTSALMQLSFAASSSQLGGWGQAEVLAELETKPGPALGSGSEESVVSARTRRLCSKCSPLCRH